MRKRATWTVAAAMAAGTFAFVGYDASVIADDALKASAKVGAGSPDRPAAANVALPDGVRRNEGGDRTGVQRTLEQATELAVTSGQFDQFLNLLTEGDRTRLGAGQMKHDKLDARIAQFRKEWRAKYNQDFDLKGEAAFGNDFAGFAIVQGEVTNPAMLSNWPVDAAGSAKLPGGNEKRIDRSGPSGGAKPEGGADAHAGEAGRIDARAQVGSNDAAAGGTASGQAAAGTKITDQSPTTPIDPALNDRSVQKAKEVKAGGADAAGGSAINDMNGRSVAVVMFPASHGAPELRVSLVRDPSGGASPDKGPAADPKATGGADANPAPRSGSVPVGGAGGVGSAGGADARGLENSSGPAPTGAAGSSSANRPTAERDQRTSGASSPAGETTIGATGGSSQVAARASGTAGTGATASTSGAVDTTMIMWRIEVPDTLTANRLQENLDKHLGMVLDMKDRWPANATEASRMVSHHVLAALYDLPANNNPGRADATPRDAAR